VPFLARADDLVVLERRILIDDFGKPDEAFLMVDTSRPYRSTHRRTACYQ
jgi:hypothetical protein